MANINNEQQFAEVYGTNDTDNIDNFGYGAKVYAFGSADVIRNFYASHSTVQGYNGNDYIRSAVNLIYVSVEGGAGNDSIVNYSNWSAFYGGEGKDTIWSGSQASNVWIDGGNDNDDITNYSSNATINGGSGNDTIRPYGNNQTIVYYKDQGQDIISYIPSDFTDNNLTIYFPNATIDDIQSTSRYAITFNDSSSIGFKSADYGYLSDVSTFKFSDNKEYYYNNGSFVEK